MLDPHELSQIISHRMDIDPNEYVVVRYHVKPSSKIKLEQIAGLIAINSSVGTVRATPYEIAKSRVQSSALVLEIIEAGNAVNIAYPLEMCKPSDGLTQLLSVILYAAEYNFTSEYRVESIELPKKFSDCFRGPQFGIEGIRHALGIAHRPILGTITKPRRGIPLDILVQKCEESLLGGADYIIEDELVVPERGLGEFRERVFTMAQMVKKVEKATGLKKWYVANINASPSKSLGYAQEAIEAGANALLTNAFTMGFAGFEDFTRHDSISVPVFTCNMGASILTRSENMGCSEAVISMTSRLSGADGVFSGISGALWYSSEVLRGSYSALINPFHGKKKAMPVVAGGLNIANLVTNICAMGQDIMLQAGTGILGYPKGPFLMASSMKKVIELIHSPMSEYDAEKKLHDLAKRDREVREALQYHKYKPKE